MARHGSMAMWLAGGAAALLLVMPAQASACEAHQAKARPEVKLDAAAKLEAEAKKVEAAQAKPATAAKPAPSKQGGEVLAEKCSCDGPGDCTCAKGKCKCAKCGQRRYKMIESLRDRAEYRVRPTRRDAAAGAFI